MNPFFCVIFLLGLSSLAAAANFTQVYQWNEFDYEWLSEASRTKALSYGTIKKEIIIPRYMAVHGDRIFLSLEKFDGIPMTLVTLQTSSESSEPPKLTPFPSWSMHGKGDCNKIQKAKGLQVDSVGTLWVLDEGSYNCSSKIWIINLINNDRIRLIHQLSFRSYLHDLVIDEKPKETFAYISRWGAQNIIVFNLERNQSWIVDTSGIKVLSITLSPKVEPRQLYLGKYDSNELYSISVDALRNGTRTANPKLIGQWNAINSYRMLMDNHGTMYAAFLSKNYIRSWNSSQPFEEQHFHKVENLNTYWPFTFALDSSGTFWLTENKWTKPRCKLLKVEVGAQPYYITDSPATDVVKYSSPDDSTFPSLTVPYIFDTTPVPDSTSPTSVPPNSTCGCVKKVQTGKTEESKNSALIGSLAFFLVLSCIFNLWLTLRIRKIRNSNDQCNAGAMEMEIPTLPNPVSPEIVHEEIENDLYGVVTALPPRPRL